jgi:hypothetical protein
MALLVRVYFNGVFGALGGLLGWMLFGVFGDKNPPQNLVIPQLLLGGALIGGLIGYFAVSVEAIRDRSLVRFCRLATDGVVLGALGGAVGMLLGDSVNYVLVQSLGARHGSRGVTLHLLGSMTARGLGWMALGLAVGLGEGIASRSLGKLSYGTLGGALGGFVGGALFGLFYLIRIDRAGTASFWGALGLIILGACIGSFSALVQGIMLPASVRVIRGWQEGREYVLDKVITRLGRDEKADIALFRDMKVEKEHASICREKRRYVLVNLHKAPAEATLVNDQPVPHSKELSDGDRIQLGHVVLRFQLRKGKPKAESPKTKAESRKPKAQNGKK